MQRWKRTARAGTLSAFFLAAVLALPLPSIGSSRSLAVEAYLAGDYARALAEWTELAGSGDPVAGFNLGMMALQGLGGSIQPELAYRYLQAAAAAGYAPAQYQLGLRELGVRGGERPVDVSAARFWMTAAARHGHPRAAWQLGRILSGEYGGVHDLKSALEWLTVAEEAGVPRASETIQAIESTLPGAESDEQEAGSSPRLAEGRGTLAQRHEFFEGQKAFISQNYAKAIEIWAPLAEAGMARAQYGIAFMLESGWGVIQDYAEAAYWYKLAAQKGHRRAQFNLGKMYVEGRGTDTDRGTGLYWIQTSADLGEARAREYLEALR